MCVYVCVDAHLCGCLWQPEEGVESPEAGVVNTLIWVPLTSEPSFQSCVFVFEADYPVAQAGLGLLLPQPPRLRF